MTIEETALLDAIAVDLDDDTARLVYADYLEENDRIEAADAIRRGVKKPKRWTFKEGEAAHLAYTGTRTDTAKIVNHTLARGYAGVTWTSYKGLIESAMTTWEYWFSIGTHLIERNFVPMVVITNQTVEPTGAYWPTVKQWAFPKLILGLNWEYPEYTDHDTGEVEHGPARITNPPQVGSTVTDRYGVKGVLLEPVDQHGYAPIRPIKG